MPGMLRELKKNLPMEERYIYLSSFLFQETLQILLSHLPDFYKQFRYC